MKAKRRRNKKEALPRLCLKVLSVCLELESLGLCPSRDGIRKILNGDPNARSFMDLAMFGAHLSLRPRQLGGALTSLLKKGYMSFVDSKDYQEKYFFLTESGKASAKVFLEAIAKKKHLPRMKSVKKDFLPMDTFPKE